MYQILYTTGPDKTESGLGRLEIENREGGAWKQNAISFVEVVGFNTFNFSPVPDPFIVCRDLPKKDPRII